MSSSSLTSLIQLLKSQTNGAADGTGVLILTERVKELVGYVPDYLIEYSLSIQVSIFGDYPSRKDIAPSAIFMVIFLIFLIAHLYIFFKNYSRGHKFWLSLLFAFYCLLRVLGWLLRVVWSTDILKMRAGIASNVFIIVPIVLLASFNLVLAQRIFTWRHPHIGSSKLLWAAMILIYFVVAGVVVMAILGAVVPYIYFLSEHHFTMCKQAVRAAAVLCVLYSVLAFVLVIGAYVLKPTTRALSIVTYQPWWIESFDIWYYVPKGAAKEAEESFKDRKLSDLDHVRIIASTTHHHATIERVQTITSKSGKLDHNYSIVIIFSTTIILLISSLFRCVSTFVAHQRSGQSWIFQPVVQYVMFGVLEVFVNVLYLIGRIDLRFYRPDKLSKSARSTCGSIKKVGSETKSAVGDETLRGSNPELTVNNEKTSETAPRSSSDLS